MALSSQPLADIGVADADGKQAEGDGKHENVEHGVFQCASTDRTHGPLHSQDEMPASA